MKLRKEDNLPLSTVNGDFCLLSRRRQALTGCDEFGSSCTKFISHSLAWSTTGGRRPRVEANDAATALACIA